MKLALTVEADTINVLALNAGRIAVDIDGVRLDDLINVVCDNGYSLRIADKPGKRVVEDPLPVSARYNGIRCSTAHITREDNDLLHQLSRQVLDFDDSEWVGYTGSGYLIRLAAWAFSDTATETAWTVESGSPVDCYPYAPLPPGDHSPRCLWRSAAGLCHV